MIRSTRLSRATRAEVRKSLDIPGRTDSSISAMRMAFDGATMMLNSQLPKIGDQHRNLRFSDSSPATLDVLVPRGAGPHPVLVYLHGGAWVAGSPSSHRKLTARFAEAGHLVFSVDYRLAPEHPFPAGLDDCMAAIRWVAANAAGYGGDASRLSVGGDSAGANLAAASAIALSQEMLAPRITALLLIYGVFNMRDMGHASANRSIHGAYLPGDLIDSLDDCRVSPIHGAEYLPPSFVVVGRQDPLLGQSRELRRRLSAAGIPHKYVEKFGMPHGFIQMEFLGGVLPLIRDMERFLHAQYEGPRDPWRYRAWRALRRWFAPGTTRNASAGTT